MAINFIHRFELLTKKPDDYLSVQNKIASDVTCLLKSLYDFTKNSEEGKTCGDALPELIVDGFDQEQIWQELELQNNGCSKCLVEDVATLVACKNRLKFPSHDEGINKKSVTDTHADLAESEKDDMDLQEVDDMDSEDGDDMDSEEEDNIDVQKEEQEDTAERGKKGQRRKSKVLDRVTEVDDKFFKLSEMEEFLEIEENHKRGDHGDSDDSIDLFRSSDEEQDEDKNVNNDKQVKSSLETRQERLKARIQQLEDKAMSEKPWQMKGEISASARPQNSLLEEAVEFDLTARPGKSLVSYKSNM
ncbi:hypothetical protein C0J52_09206 [Blattella germanica]|nr:hypothetical protein C0J52_09206 [Blattella germanica]